MSSSSASKMTPGILPAHAIRGMLEDGSLSTSHPLDADQVQPASLDLRLGDTAYRVRASFLPGTQATVAERLEDLALHRMPLDNSAVLETGCVYIVPLLERLALPTGIHALANPKSSTGRIDVFTRVIADHAREFDKIAPDYTGPLYAEISPRTFPILVRTGSRLAQMRFRRGPATFSDAETASLNEREHLVSSRHIDIDNGVALSVDLAGSGDGGPAGYRAKRHSALIDVDQKASLDVLDYWEPIARCTSLILDPNEFYILASKEAVRVPPTHAAEMVPFNPLVGEFRVHYAGFFDPGFGHSSGSGEGSRAVLEVRSHEVPFILEDGQTVGRLIYETLTEPPEHVYGSGIGSHYQKQGLKLSKHFRLP